MFCRTSLLLDCLLDIPSFFYSLNDRESPALGFLSPLQRVFFSLRGALSHRPHRPSRPVPRLVCESTVHSRGRVQERRNGRWRSSVFHPAGIRPIRETPSHSPRSRTPALGSRRREASLLLGKIPGSSPPIDWDRSPTKGVHRLGKPRSLRATTP